MANARQPSMTVEEFEQRKATLICRTCRQARLKYIHISTNNSLRVVCACGDTMPINGRIENLKHTTKARRKEYPEGQSLAEVWERYGNCCVVCGAPKDFIDRIGWTRERHHVMAYVDHEHAGPIVPMCGPCHHNTTQRQKLFWFWFRRENARHGEQVSGRGTGVSRHGVAPDPVPAATKDPHRELEGFSDRAANQ